MNQKTSFACSDVYIVKHHFRVYPKGSLSKLYLITVTYLFIKIVNNALNENYFPFKWSQVLKN